MKTKAEELELVFLVPPPSGECETCGEVDELRPYGPNGEWVCFECAMQDEEAAGEKFEELFAAYNKEGSMDRRGMESYLEEKIEKLKNGEEVVMDDAQLDEAEKSLPDEMLNHLRSIPNPDRVGTKDKYLVWVGGPKEGYPKTSSRSLRAADWKVEMFVGDNVVGTFELEDIVDERAGVEFIIDEHLDWEVYPMGGDRYRVQISVGGREIGEWEVSGADENDAVFNAIDAFIDWDFMEVDSKEGAMRKQAAMDTGEVLYSIDAYNVTPEQVAEAFARTYWEESRLPITWVKKKGKEYVFKTEGGTRNYRVEFQRSDGRTYRDMWWVVVDSVDSKEGAMKRIALQLTRADVRAIVDFLNKDTQRYLDYMHDNPDYANNFSDLPKQENYTRMEYGKKIEGLVKKYDMTEEELVEALEPEDATCEMFWGHTKLDEDESVVFGFYNINEEELQFDDGMDVELSVGTIGICSALAMLNDDQFARVQKETDEYLPDKAREDAARPSPNFEIYIGVDGYVAVYRDTEEAVKMIEDWARDQGKTEEEFEGE